MSDDLNPVSVYPIYRDCAKKIAQEFQDGDLIPMGWLRLELAIAEPDLTILTNLPLDEWQEKASEMIKKHQFAWLEAIDGLRNELLQEWHIAIKNVRGQGYLLLPPREQTTHAMHQLQVEYNRSFRKAMDLTVNIRFSELDDKERQENIEARAKLEALKRMNSRRNSIAHQPSEAQ